MSEKDEKRVKSRGEGGEEEMHFKNGDMPCKGRVGRWAYMKSGEISIGSVRKDERSIYSSSQPGNERR